MNKINSVTRDAIVAPEQFFNQYYHVFYQLALAMLPSIPFFPGEKILDVGCRNGKVSEALARLYPDNQFTAVTTNKGFQEIVNKDETLQLPNLQFISLYLDQYHPEKNYYDKVVSFLCLTWFQDKGSVLAKIFQALKPHARSYIQLFVDHGQDWFDECIFTVANRPEWKGYFKNFKKRVQHHKPGAFLALCEENGFIIEKSELIKRRIPIQNESYFIHWMMTWSSHLDYLRTDSSTKNYLPDEKIEEFYTLALENYLKSHPRDLDGKLYYQDYFLETTLLKPGMAVPS